MPLTENIDFFTSVYSDQEDPEKSAREHCVQFEAVRSTLHAMVMVESLVSDVCSLGNGEISLMGEKISKLMTGQKEVFCWSVYAYVT